MRVSPPGGRLRRPVGARPEVHDGRPQQRVRLHRQRLVRTCDQQMVHVALVHVAEHHGLGPARMTRASPAAARRRRAARRSHVSRLAGGTAWSIEDDAGTAPPFGVSRPGRDARLLVAGRARDDRERVALAARGLRQVPGRDHLDLEAVAHVSHRVGLYSPSLCCGFAFRRALPRRAGFGRATAAVRSRRAYR